MLERWENFNDLLEKVEDSYAIIYEHVFHK